MSNILAGYQLHITSWENDGDHCETKIISGLKAGDVCFLIDLLKLFKAGSNNTDCFGNRGCTEGGDKYHNNDISQVLSSVSKVLKEHALAMTLELYSTFDVAREDIESLHEFINDRLLGYTTVYYYENYFFRVFDNFKVFNYPQEVVNVTEQFK